MIECTIFVCLLLVIYTTFLYPLVLAFIAKLYQNRTNARPLLDTKVSLIIAAYNEEKDIEKKILNSLELEYPNLEIVVASDGSSDRTPEICKKYAERITFFDRKQRSGKINTLNAVVPKVKGDILLFSDANTFYEKNVIQELVKHFHDKNVGCTTGHVQLVADGKEHEQGEGIFTRLEQYIQQKESSIHSVIGLDGAMYAMRKELYEPLGNYFIEDFVMGMNIIKKGYRVIYDPLAKGSEASSENLKDEFKRKSRIVAGGFQSLPFMTFLFRKPFPFFAFFSHKVLRWLTVELLLIVFILNLFLLNNKVFLALFIAQILFYTAALLGVFIKPLSFVYYFVFMQIASLWGLVKYLFNMQKITWNKAKRN